MQGIALEIIKAYWIGDLDTFQEVSTIHSMGELLTLVETTTKFPKRSLKYRSSVYRHFSCTDQQCLRQLMTTFPFQVIYLIGSLGCRGHYSDVIMGAMASQFISITIVYSTVYSGTDQRKPQSSASLAIVRGIHQWPVNSPHKEPVTRKMFPFDDVIMFHEISSAIPNDTAWPSKTYSKPLMIKWTWYKTCLIL